MNRYINSKKNVMLNTKNNFYGTGPLIINWPVKK